MRPMSGRRRAVNCARRPPPRARPPDLIETGEPCLSKVKAPPFLAPTMPRELQISIGQHSDKGRKAVNQDFHGALIPEQPLLAAKGIAIVLADGISSSNVSQVA